MLMHSIWAFRHPKLAFTFPLNILLDINECLIDNGGCEKECRNTPGSFVCQCPTGSHLDSDARSCMSLDACANDNGGCEGICVTLNGTRVCGCSAGFELHSDGVHCRDVDECVTNNGGCSATCQNTHGSFVCGCHQGFELGKQSSRVCSKLSWTKISLGIPL